MNFVTSMIVSFDYDVLDKITLWFLFFIYIDSFEYTFTIAEILLLTEDTAVIFLRKPGENHKTAIKGLGFISK